MPVKSLSLPVLVWPNAETVDRAVREWVKETLISNQNVIRAGYYGSYARGDWGVGSDLDLIIIIEVTNEPFERRAATLNTTSLPVPVDILIYTKQEWQKLENEQRFVKQINQEVIWIYKR
jgi:predicted nucleotidyltransferase